MTVSPRSWTIRLAPFAASLWIGARAEAQTPAASPAPATATSSAVPRPEHPRPQNRRDDWLTLNGTWEFAEGDDLDVEKARALERFPDRIVVPFCRESRLSGLARTGFVKNVAYRRGFSLPSSWQGRRVLLHVGACDWRTTAWLNGVALGVHEGGSAPITFEITSALASGQNELRIHAFDDTRSGKQQLGKQAKTPDSESIFYTRTTGIWQSVWIEAVGTTYLSGFATYTDPEAGTVTLIPRLEGPTDGLTVRVDVQAGEREVGAAFAPARRPMAPIVVALDEKRPWSLEDPFLYDLELSVVRVEGGDNPTTIERLDRVHSYFGLRSVGIAGHAVTLNGKPVFERLVLDQGFYPDGIWTAPSEEAMQRDIELSKAAGFNGARLHQKVFEPRFHYWADKLGYLTWGEAPSYGADYGDPAVDRVAMQEWVEVLLRDRNHPSIVGWCPFNETETNAGKLQIAACEATRAVDPTRLVLDTSGYTHSFGGRDVDDAHDYEQDPARFRARYLPFARKLAIPARYGARRYDKPFFVSEYGGIGWIPPGEKGWGYGGVPKTEEEWLARFKGLADAQLDNPMLFGFCYTQLTDVEQERNGVLFYDRRPKFELAKLHAILARPAAIEEEAPSADPSVAVWKVLVPSAIDDPARPWSCAMTAGPIAGEEWKRGSFGAANAVASRPGFGHKDGFEVVIGTPWTTSDLYLARTFEWDGEEFGSALLVMHHDNEVELCLNGAQLFARDGWNDAYEPFDVTERLHALLRKGANTLAVHVHQDEGGQYFDAALLLSPTTR